MVSQVVETDPRGVPDRSRNYPQRGEGATLVLSIGWRGSGGKNVLRVGGGNLSGGGGITYS